MGSWIPKPECWVAANEQTDEEFSAALEEAMMAPLTDEDIAWIESLGGRLPSPLESHFRFCTRCNSD